MATGEQFRPNSPEDFFLDPRTRYPVGFVEGDRLLPWPQLVDRPAVGVQRGVTHSPASPSKAGGSVYAYTGELDRWREARKLAIECDPTSNEGEPQDPDLPKLAGNGIAPSDGSLGRPAPSLAALTRSPC